MYKKKIQTSVLAVFAVGIVGFSFFLMATPAHAETIGEVFNQTISGFFKSVQTFVVGKPQPVALPVKVKTVLPDTKISKETLTPIIQEILANYPFAHLETTKYLTTKVIKEPTYTTSTITNNTTTTNTVAFDLSGVMKNGLLYVDSNSSLQAVGAGTAGQVLTSNGTGSLPSWLTLPTGLDWSAPGVIGSVTPNEGIFTDLSIAYSGDTGSLTGEGAFRLDNSSNIGNGFSLKTTAGAEAAGDLMNVSVTNHDFQNSAFHLSYYGDRNGLEVVSNSTGSASNALAVTGNNINDSTVGIIGYELGRGTIKVSHYRPTGLNDNNASAISIDLRGSGTAAQGLYVDSTEAGGTTGNLLRLRNQTVDKFVVNYQGNVSQGAYGYDTTYTKFGNTSGDQFFVGTNGAFRVQRAGASSEAFRTQISGDTQGRWLGTADGQLKWGSGTAVQDIVLKRSTVGILTLDGGMTFNNSNGAYDTVIKGATDSNLFHVDAANDKIGIGTSVPVGAVQITRNGGGNADFIVNQTGAFDILTASASGVTKFTVDNSGNLLSAVGSGWRPISDSTSALQIQTSTASAFTSFDTTNGRVGIGVTTPTAKLQISGGDILMDNNASLRMKDSGGSARPILVYTGSNNVQLLNSAATGFVQVGINNASNTSNLRFTTGAGTEKMRIDNAGVGIGATTFGTSATNVLAIANGTIPGSSIVSGVQLYAESVASSSELKVRDEAGNVTTLSPHNFSVIPDGKSDPLAWAFYSQRGDLALNVDMLKAVRQIESLSGEQLVYIKNLNTGEYQPENITPSQIGLNQGSVVKIAEVVPEPTVTTNQFADEMVKKSEIASYVSWSDQVWSFMSEVVFQMKATFQKPAAFLAGAVFKGPITVNQDTAGKVTIPAGATKVKITFSTAFSSKPIIYLSPNQTLAGGYTLDEVTQTDFVIHLNQAQAGEVQINWLAVLQVEGSQTQSQVLESGGGAASTPTANSAATPTLEPTPSPEVNPTPTPSPLPSSPPIESVQTPTASSSASN